jgi:hypothetical protein
MIGLDRAGAGLLLAAFLVLSAFSGFAECSGASHDTSLVGFAISSDNSRIAVLARDGTLFLWNVQSGQRTVLMNCDAPGEFSTPITFSPDSTWLAVGESPRTGADETDLNATVELFELGKSPRYLSANVGNIESLAFSGNGRLLAIGGNNGVNLWSVAEGKKLLSLPHTRREPAPALNHDGSLLAVAADGIELWDTATAQRIRTIKLREKQWAESLSFAHDDQWIVGLLAEALPSQPKDRLRRYRRQLAVWDVALGSRLKTLEGETDEAAYPLAVAGNTVYVSSDENKLQAWDMTTGRQLGNWDTRPGVVSADGKFFLRSTSPPGRLELWKIGATPDNFQAFEYRSPLCAPKFSIGADGVPNEQIKFHMLAMFDGATDDHYGWSGRNYVADDCTFVSLVHYYFPTLERARQELQRHLDRSGRIIEKGPPKGFWQRELLTERYVFALDSITVIAWLRGKDYYEISSASADIALEFEKQSLR